MRAVSFLLMAACVAAPTDPGSSGSGDDPTPPEAEESSTDFDPSALNAVVVTGDHDDIVSVLEEIGVEDVMTIDGSDPDATIAFLSDLAAMAEHDVVFVASGAVESGVFYEGGAVSDTIQANLRDYVAGGGAVFVTERAYDVIELGWPDATDFTHDDHEPNSAELGVACETTASIADSELEDWVGASTVGVRYPSANWAPIADTASASTVYLSGSITYQLGTSEYSVADNPLLLSFAGADEPGSGLVMYATFPLSDNTDAAPLSVITYMLSLI